jgi:hypothetical protein
MTPTRDNATAGSAGIKENAMTTAPATATVTPLATVPTAIFALLGVIDIALLGVVGSSIAPPLPVSIGVAVLGVITLAALVPARRGNRPARAVAVTARIISALLAFAAFFAGAPAWVMAVEGFVICATVVALVALRRARTA